MGVILTTFAFVVLLACGYSWGQTFYAVRTVRDQLKAIDEGLYPQAYNYLSSSAKAKLSFREFVALIEKNSVVREGFLSTFPRQKTVGSTVTISGVLRGYSQYSTEAEYLLVKEGDDWKIDGVEWGPPRSLQD